MTKRKKTDIKDFYGGNFIKPPLSYSNPVTASSIRIGCGKI